jgi:beta-mannanase
MQSQMNKRRRTPRGPQRLAATAAAMVALALATASCASAQRAPVALGAYIPHADENPSLIDSFGNQVGWNPVIVTSFKTFDQAPIYYPQLNGIEAHGAVPMVTWEPQTSDEGRIKLSKIARGDYDGYVGDAARTAAAWGKPLMIRFGQEMNGSWYPWSPAAGNPARSFVSAWRHVVGIFRREGARNVKWVWTPYVNANGRLGFTRFYPGDRYVDWVGLDGYNWGGRFPWMSFRELYAGSYDKLVHISERPVMIGEVGCGEVGGNKARWVRLMFRRDVPRMSRIRAVVWFDDGDPKGKGDLSVDTSAGALASFRRWTDRPIYAADKRELLRTPRLFR